MTKIKMLQKNPIVSITDENFNTGQHVYWHKLHKPHSCVQRLFQKVEPCYDVSLKIFFNYFFSIHKEIQNRKSSMLMAFAFSG